MIEGTCPGTSLNDNLSNSFFEASWPFPFYKAPWYLNPKSPSP